jgi:hypothetical protein
MKVNSYRVELERLDGSLCGISHFSSLSRADEFVNNRKVCIDIVNNSIPNNNRYATIWESELVCNN